MQTTKAIKRIN